MYKYEIRDDLSLSKIIAQFYNLNSKNIFEVLKLLNSGSTIPFIARYRKEVSGNLDDEFLRKIVKKYEEELSLDERRVTIFNTLNELNIDDKQLFEDILKADSLNRLEDLYRPYKPKKKTKASEAIRKGLLPLSKSIKENKSENELNILATSILNSNDELKDLKDCFQGASDIIAQELSDSEKVRSRIKRHLLKNGLIKSVNKKDEDSVYRNYYNFTAMINKIKAHQVLALNRGEANDYLKVDLEMDEEFALLVLNQELNVKNSNEFVAGILKETVKDCFKRLLYPSVENEIRTMLTTRASEESFVLFSKNLKQLLLTPPIKNKRILALDPGYKNGCKYATVDEFGKYLSSGVVYITKPNLKITEAKEILLTEIKNKNINLVAIGNGTACRETEEFYVALNKENDLKIPYVLVDESGASVYSATELAAKELPNVDLNNRSAVSLARRILDPLAELVKIDPKAIGLGQYQHDLNQKLLQKELDGVVENCVNLVGVDVNSASASLLSYISGLNKTLVDNIVKYREINGGFNSRQELLKVAKMGSKTFEQCVGFLRVENINEPLDNSAIHPESYNIAKKFISDFNLKLNSNTNLSNEEIKEYASKNNLGYETLLDINNAICKAKRDVREDFASPTLSFDIKDVKDLKIGDILEGTVRNITNFGAFIDLGIHHSGLLHISEISNNFIKNVSDVLSVGDRVKVKIIEIDIAKNKLQLTMKNI